MEEPGRQSKIVVEADEIIVSGPSESPGSFSAAIFTATLPSFGVQADPAGSSGNIELFARRVLLLDGGLVSTVTSTNGRAGSIRIEANELIITGVNLENEEPRGRLLREFSFISAGSANLLDAGNAGDIVVLGVGEDSKLLLTDGGNIHLNVSKRLEMFGGPDILFTFSPTLPGGSITTDVRGGLETTGGNIAISNPDFVILENGAQGQGVNIDITTKALLVSDDSVISASSELGVSGTVQVNAPDSDLTTNLETLSQDYLDAVELRNRCAEGPDESQFRVASRMLQGTPDGMLPSFALASAPQVAGSCR